MTFFRELFGFTSDRRHLFLIVGVNQWPLNTASSLFVTILGLVLYLHNYGIYPFLLGLCWILKNIFYWIYNILEESEIYHTLIVRKNLKMGFILFITSEIMLFLGFFWAFFHSSLSPSIILGLHWLSVGIIKAEPFWIPFFNTLLLIMSGISITWAHNAILMGSYRECVHALTVTIVLACWFLVLQGFEYYELPFNITDGIYPSVFFMLTGLHGFHVLFGTIFIIVCLVRVLNWKYLTNHHLGFVLAIYYWHFVDIVWIGLFLTVYCWTCA